MTASVKRNVVPYGAAVAVSLAAFLLDRHGMNAAAGGLLLILAAGLGIWFYRKDKSLVSFRLLLSVFWIGGEGLAAFRLSCFHTSWTAMSWLSFSLFYLVWLAAYDLTGSVLAKRNQGAEEEAERENADSAASVRRVSFRPHTAEQEKNHLFMAVWILTAVSWAAFLFEAVYLGYIPLFSTEPHAYSYFHISGVHYVTVSCTMVPALAVLYWLQYGKPKGARFAVLGICCALSLLIPVLCVSKFIFIFAIGIPVILVLLSIPEIPGWIIGAGLGAVAVLFAAIIVLMTAGRHYEPGFLDSVFEIHRDSIPVMLQYVYMYIANNYANFNELTIAVSAGRVPYLYGLRQLFPLFALTGLKFVFPSLVSYEVPVTKDILNTLTIIYDAFYDFGLPGVIGFAAILGAVCAAVTSGTKKRRKNPAVSLLYAQLAIYLALSFFSAWFSLATTWFWLAGTALLGLFTVCPKQTRNDLSTRKNTGEKR